MCVYVLLLIRVRPGPDDRQQRYTCLLAHLGERTGQSTSLYILTLTFPWDHGATKRTALGCLALARQLIAQIRRVPFAMLRFLHTHDTVTRTQFESPPRRGPSVGSQDPQSQSD